MIINVAAQYGVTNVQISIENYRKLNPAGEFKELHDGSIMEIFSDEPGDWEIIAKPDRAPGNNTKIRSEFIFNTAASVLEAAGGCIWFDQTINAQDRYISLDAMYKSVMEQTGCVRATAKRNIAKALRRARYGEIVKRGGARPGPHPGRPLKIDITKEAL